MIGETILHYTILEKLGEGGMGVVYKARDTKLDRNVAIKFLPRHVATSETERSRFTLEAKAAAALNHPNIATIHAIEEVDDETFIVMEYVEGQELKKKLADGPLPVEDAVRIAVQIAEGLQAAHRKEIVHRDIKSANIMLTADGQVKVMDFGLAKVRGSAQVTREGTTVGTAAYMSPEQARGEEVDHRSDIWSFGVVLYEILAGRLPFTHEYDHALTYSILNETPGPVTEHRPDTPDVLAKVVHRAMAKERDARYQTAEEVLADLKSVGERIRPAGAGFRHLTLRQRFSQPKVWIPSLLLAGILAAAGVWGIDRVSSIRQAREEGLPAIEQAIQDGVASDGQKAWKAFGIAQHVENVIPDDPLLARLSPQFSRNVWILSDPPGAAVYAKPYSDPAMEWRPFGRTPVDSIRFPLGFSRIRVEKAGYGTVHDLAWNSPFFSDTLQYVLAPDGTVPDRMELIPATGHWYEISAAPAGLHLPGLEHLKGRDVGGFFMDRYEVTNRAFKEFLDAGGYRERKYWKYPFIANGRTLTWEDAMSRFVDRTGRPGPATWEVGGFPAGRENFPVSGVSWYEAAAYAEFAGKRLPTIYHWDRVAFPWASSVIVPMSNLRGDGPVEVGSTDGMNRFGVYDLGGNVREWCFNESSRGGRFILGGGWNDPAYSFNDAYAQAAMDRSETNGFRCIKPVGSDPVTPDLEAVVVFPTRNFLKEPIASDREFAMYRRQYAYDRAPLHATVDSLEEGPEWVKQRITFDAAYGGERMMGYLFLPNKGRPPYQTIVYFPGSGAIHTRSSESIRPDRFDFLVKSGRAFFYPVYKSTYERGDGLYSDYPDSSVFWKEHVLMWAKDFSRSIDYLETRDDIDRTKLAYFGVSWGGAMGGIIPAVEPRVSVTVLVVAGLQFQRSLPEVEALNFLPRIRTPVLMLNGKYDFFFPYDTAQLPFVELLGTPREHKRLIAYEGGHSVPRTQLVKETLLWLDRYLGEVR